MKVCMYASKQVCKFANTQVCIYASMQVCMYTCCLVRFAALFFKIVCWFGLVQFVFSKLSQLTRPSYFCQNSLWQGSKRKKRICWCGVAEKTHFPLCPLFFGGRNCLGGRGRLGVQAKKCYYCTTQQNKMYKYGKAQLSLSPICIIFLLQNMTWSLS